MGKRLALLATQRNKNVTRSVTNSMYSSSEVSAAFYKINPFSGLTQLTGRQDVHPRSGVGLLVVTT